MYAFNIYCSWELGNTLRDVEDVELLESDGFEERIGLMDFVLRYAVVEWLLEWYFYNSLKLAIRYLDKFLLLVSLLFEVLGYTGSERKVLRYKSWEMLFFPGQTQIGRFQTEGTRRVSTSTSKNIFWGVSIPNRLFFLHLSIFARQSQHLDRGLRVKLVVASSDQGKSEWLQLECYAYGEWFLRQFAPVQTLW